MASDFNTVLLVGMVRCETEMIALNDKAPYAKFILTTHKSWYKDGVKQREINHHCILLNGSLLKLAEEKTLIKGQRILVSGELLTRQWKDLQGYSHYSSSIIAKRLCLLSDNSNFIYEMNAD